MLTEHCFTILNKEKKVLLFNCIDFEIVFVLD